MTTPDPLDTLKFIRARADDLLECMADMAVGTHGDEEFGEFIHSLQVEIDRATDPHLTDTDPLVYGDGTAVKVEFSLGNVTHVRWPSHPARGKAAS